MKQRSFLRATLGVALLVPGSARAQQALDWPVRAEARPEALAAGAAALLWNPARAVPDTGRVELAVLDLSPPDATGVSGIAVVAAARLRGGWVVGAAYQHTGAGDMTWTDGPPVGVSGPEFEVAEDLFAVGGSLHSPMGWSAGATLRFLHPSEELGESDVWQSTLGAAYEADVGPIALTAGATALAARDRVTFGGGVEAAPRTPPLPVDLSLAWGAAERQSIGVAHRIVARGVWRRIVEVQAGAAIEPGAVGHTVAPTASADVRLGRYVLGVVREQLPNGFGGVMHYRLSLSF